jgi:anti-sigma regulatory factor (Ser/Thr protein kinase)
MATATTSSEVRFAAGVVADLTELAEVRDALADALCRCRWSDEDAFRVLVCADEAMANAVSHGSAEAGTIDIRFRVDQGAVNLVIGDHCTTETSIPSPLAIPDDTSEHGRGVILMRALADVFRMMRRPTGTLVALRFRVAEGAAR